MRGLWASLPVRTCRDISPTASTPYRTTTYSKPILIVTDPPIAPDRSRHHNYSRGNWLHRDVSGHPQLFPPSFYIRRITTYPKRPPTHQQCLEKGTTAGRRRHPSVASLLDHNHVITYARASWALYLGALALLHTYNATPSFSTIPTSTQHTLLLTHFAGTYVKRYGADGTRLWGFLHEIRTHQWTLLPCCQHHFTRHRLLGRFPRSIEI